MTVTEASIRRPVFTVMVTLMVLVLGLVSLEQLKIDLLPRIELPTVSIHTDYEGASPEVVERLVTQIVEEIVATVPGVEEITSESTEGESTVRAKFVWGTDIDTAAVDVQSILQNEITELPEDIVRPHIRKYDVDSFPVVILGVSSQLDPVELTQILEDQIRYRFARIPGVAQVDPWGEYQREIRIELDPYRLNALGLPLDKVLDAIRDSNLDLPAGRIEEGKFEVSVRVPAEFTNLDQIRNTVIERGKDSAVTIRQIAKVKDTYEKKTRIIRVNGDRGLRVAVRKQSEANTVEVSKNILKEMDAFKKEFPQVEMIPVKNQGNFIERSISNVAQSVLYGGGLAVLVLFLFLRDLRSTVVISLAIPISVVATFALLYFSGFTLNLMTLGGLALGVGMMVDSSVVVVENIFRHYQEDRESPHTAAVKGTKEVASAIIASTITTMVIFLPLIYVQGVSGVLFKELAYVVMFSLFCSLLVSLTLAPMLASRLAQKQTQRTGNAVMEAGDPHARNRGGLFREFEYGYRDLLRWVLRHRFLTVTVSVALFIGSLMLIPHIGTEFLPPSDEGEVRVIGEMEVGTRLDRVDRQTRILEDIVFASVPEKVSSITSAVTASRRAGGASQGEIRLRLTPSAERERSNKRIAEELRPVVENSVPGMKIKTRAPQGQFLLERLLASEEGVIVEIRGFDLDTLDLLSERVAAAIADVPGITDVDISRQAGIPQQNISVDRAKVSDLGLSVRDVTEIIETALTGTDVGEYRLEGNSHRILVQLENAEKRTLGEILDLKLATPSGELVSLRNVVDTSTDRGPVLIERKDQQRQVSIEANVSGRDLGSVARDVQERLDRLPRPNGYDLRVAGNFEEQQKAFRQLMVALVLALLLVYMVLASQYESLRDPLVVMVSVPLAAIGVLLMLFLTWTTLNLQSYIGCIMLGGIVINNAILLVDQAGQLRRKDMNVHEALAEAGRRRLRPILMTTLTTILALMPLAFGVGEGADAQAPLARAVIGGLGASTLITLLLIPVIYSFFHPETEFQADPLESPRDWRPS